MDPMTLLALGSGASSLLGSMFGGPDYNELMAQYREQFLKNYMALAGLTMGAENAPGYADRALGAFQRSAAYQGMLGNLGTAANAASQGARTNAAAGQNFGVGQAAYNLGNPATMMNSMLMQAMLRQYLQGQSQFGQLAGLRLQGASDMARGGSAWAGGPTPTLGQRFGSGLMNLGNAGLQAAMMGGFGNKTANAESIASRYREQNPAWDQMPPYPDPGQPGPPRRPLQPGPLWVR